MKHFFNLIFVVCLLFAFETSGQKMPYFGKGTAQDVPGWAKLMYEENPNVWKVEKAYLAYYRERPFEKTIHTQFYKKWRRIVEPYVQADGSLKFPSIEEKNKELEAYAALLKTKGLAQEKIMQSWKALGPFETFSTGNNQTRVSWQTNVYCLDVFDANPDILYAGTEAGGLFKTIDKGENWFAVSASAPFKTVRSVKIKPDNDQIILVGTRDEVYQTLDGGTTWTVILQENQLEVNSFVFDETNPDIILVAGRKGVDRSEDGGQTWTRTFNSFAYDLIASSDGGKRLFLLADNGPASNLYVSDDQGQNFELRNQGWYVPSGNESNSQGGRIAVSKADPNRVYVILIGQDKEGDNGFIGVYKSEDYGNSWTLPNGPAGGPYTFPGHPNLASINPNGTGFHQGYYNLAIEASDDNADELLVGCLNLWRSRDGAATFEPVGGYQGSVSWIHPDQQDMEIVDGDMWLVNDGGINLSHDLFETHTAKTKGINGADFWGFGSAWNEDLLVGGRYHNGNTAFRPSFPEGQSLRLGGGEAPTGYVNPGGVNETYFSDIGSKIIPYDISGDVINFAKLAKYPNESYFAANSSEMEFDPRYHNHIYVGLNNELWKSTDKGQSFELLHAFGTNVDAPVFHFDISRSNPDVMYVYQRTSFYGAVLWKSEDAGLNWVQKDFPGAGSQRSGVMTLDPEDENHIYVGFAHQNNDGRKVFESKDGGDTWINLSPSTLDGQQVHAIFYQGGSNDALYLATNKTVFYKDASMQDWELYNENLPFVLNGNILRPFYKEDKLRLATYGNGIWEVPFQHASKPVAQPMVDKQFAFCSRDTFYFDDYSILNHTNATWNWTFEPQPMWIDDAQKRNPKVVFGQIGVYNVTLNISNDAGQSTKTIENMVEVLDDACQPETIPGLAIDLNGTDGSVAFDATGVATNEWTTSAWIKRRSPQNDWGGIVFCRGGNTIAGLSIRSNGDLGYHWNNSGWSWSSNLNVPEGEWVYVAMRVTPDSVTLMMNDQMATHLTSISPEEFDGPWNIGVDPNGGSRYFNGLIDEVAIWNQALSNDEIRLLRHLVKSEASNPVPDHYYQFNQDQGDVLDRIGLLHGKASGSSSRTSSTVPVGKGASQIKEMAGAGKLEFEDVDFSISMNANAPSSGQLVVSKIENQPDILPFGDYPIPGYVILNNYGIEILGTLDSLGFLKKDTIKRGEVDIPELFLLYDRPENGEGDTWQELSLSSRQEEGQPGNIHFAPQQREFAEGQFFIMKKILVGTQAPENFTARYFENQNMVRLDWNFDLKEVEKYEIEKRVEDQAFVKIGELPHTSSNTGFTFFDNQPGEGKITYRIKYFYKNGNTGLSSERDLVIKKAAYEVQVFPNPLVRGDALTILNKNGGNYRLEIIGTEGKLLEQFELNGNRQEVKLDLAAGTYFYRIVSEWKMINGSLIVQ